DGDLLGDGGAQSDPQVGLAADADVDVGVLDRREALELDLHRVGSRIEIEEAELPLGIRHLHLRSADAGERDGHPGKRLPLLVGDRAEDVPRLQLRDGRNGHRQQQGGEHETRVAASAHAGPPFKGPLSGDYATSSPRIPRLQKNGTTPASQSLQYGSASMTPLLTL